MDVELRHLRAFVAVAEELSFTRAAQRLFVAQQALSTQIRQLEDRLGVRLFERNTHYVSLTATGLDLYDRVVPALAEIDASLESARSLGQPSVRLVVGFVASVQHALYAPCLAEFCRAHPEVELVVRFGDTTDPTGGLRTRDADVVFTYGPFNLAGLESWFLVSEPLGLVMSIDNSLASESAVTIRQMINEPTFDFPTADQAWREFWMATRFRKGRPPHIVAQYSTLDGLIEAIRAGLGVHLGSRSLAAAAGPTVVWRPVPGLPDLEHFVTRRIGDDRPQVEAFYRAMAEMPHGRSVELPVEPPKRRTGSTHLHTEDAESVGALDRA